MSLAESNLEQAFKTYFDEMDKCLNAECFWALLHIVVVLPDICAALEHPKGDTTGEAGRCYEDWCSRYWPSSTTILPRRRWEIRCALLHQGRTALRDGETFSYISPAAAGSRVHEYVDRNEPNTTLEVDKMAAEVKVAVRAWFVDLLKLDDKDTKRTNVERYLPQLAGQRPKALPPDRVSTDSSMTIDNISSTEIDPRR